MVKLLTELSQCNQTALIIYSICFIKLLFSQPKPSLNRNLLLSKSTSYRILALTETYPLPKHSLNRNLPLTEA